MMKQLKWWLSGTQLAIALILQYSRIWPYSKRTVMFAISHSINVPAIFPTALLDMVLEWWQYHRSMESWPPFLNSNNLFILVVPILWFLVGLQIELQFNRSKMSSWARITKDGFILALGLYTLYGMRGLHWPVWGELRILIIGYFLWFLVLVTYGTLDMIFCMVREYKRVVVRTNS